MRPRLYLFPLLLGALLAASLFATPGARAADGAIAGQIVGQNGAKDVGNATVTLTIGTAAGGTPQSRTTQVGADGSFRFDGFTYDASAVYLVRVLYDGGNYFREVEFPTGSASAHARHDPGLPGRARRERADRAAHEYDLLHLSTRTAVAQAIETGAYNNASDRAFIGADSAAGGARCNSGCRWGRRGSSRRRG